MFIWSPCSTKRKVAITNAAYFYMN